MPLVSTGSRVGLGQEPPFSTAVIAAASVAWALALGLAPSIWSQLVLTITALRGNSSTQGENWVALGGGWFQGILFEQVSMPWAWASTCSTNEGLNRVKPWPSSSSGAPR